MIEGMKGSRVEMNNMDSEASLACFRPQPTTVELLVFVLLNFLSLD